MAPGRKRNGRKEQKNNANFYVNTKSGVIKGSNGSSVKKSKDKTVPKKKVYHIIELGRHTLFYFAVIIKS
jgi:hypothetical protein